MLSFELTPTGTDAGYRIPRHELWGYEIPRPPEERAGGNSKFKIEN